jgi:hypothetical protein
VSCSRRSGFADGDQIVDFGTPTCHLDTWPCPTNTKLRLLRKLPPRSRPKDQDNSRVVTSPPLALILRWHCLLPIGEIAIARHENFGNRRSSEPLALHYCSRALPLALGSKNGGRYSIGRRMLTILRQPVILIKVQTAFFPREIGGQSGFGTIGSGKSGSHRYRIERCRSGSGWLSTLKRDREFESPSLQRGVTCEPRRPVARSTGERYRLVCSAGALTLAPKSPGEMRAAGHVDRAGLPSAEIP